MDEVLLAHPSVRQALCSAIPHVQLGEEIGAAVELEPGGVLDAGSVGQVAAILCANTGIGPGRDRP